MGDIKFLLKEHKDEIRQMFRAQVVGIFGSYARGDDKVGSDVYVLVNFEDGATLFDLVGLDDYIEGMFGLPVDVVSMGALHAMMKNEVLRELVAL